MSHSLLATKLLTFGTEPTPLSTSVDAFKQKSVTSETLNGILAESTRKPQMLWFYADWCGHCHNMKTQWEYAHVNGQHAAGWHVVDCAEEGRSLVSEFGIKSFPSIVRIKNRARQFFEGTRDGPTLIAFAESSTI